MRHCPNPECPHARAHGAAAEFRDDIARCSDCASTLVDGEAPEPRASERPSGADAVASPAARGALVRRAAISALVPPAVWFALTRVLLPGIDRDALRGEPTLFAAGESLSLGALGVGPIVSAFVLVEIVALGVPRWRALRASGPDGRARLTRAAWWCAALLAGVQALGIALYAESVRTGDGLALVPEPSWSVRAVMVAALLAATGLFALAARVVSRRGLVNGVAAFLALGVVVDLGERARRTVALVAAGQLAPALLVALAGLVALVFVAALRLLAAAPAGSGAARERPRDTAWRELVHYRSAVRDEPPLEIALQVPTSGLVPVSVVTSLLVLPSTLGTLLGTRPLAVDQGSPYTWAVEAVAMTALALWLARAFQRPAAVAALAARAVGGAADDAGFLSRLRAALRRADARTIALVLMVGLAAPVIGSRLGVDTFPPAAGLVLLVAVLLDARAEWRARAALGALETAWSEHRLYATEVAAYVLARDEVPAFVRGTRVRALLQFFGPYVPLEVMVPPDDAAYARETLEPVLAERAAAGVADGAAVAGEAA